MQIRDILQTFSPQESAEILGTREEKVLELVSNGRLRGATIDDSVRIPAYALAALFEDFDEGGGI